MRSKEEKSNLMKLESLEDRVNTLGRAVFGSENFGKVANAAVVTSSRLQRGFSDQLAKGLHFYNLPTQDDVVALAEQCSRIEERLVNIESALISLTASSAQKSPTPRTKKPVAKSNADQPKTKSRRSTSARGKK